MRWENPLRDLMLMQERMNRLFEESMRHGADAEAPDSAWLPAADAFEADGELLVLVDLPGIEREDVQLDIDQGRLTLKGERRLPDGVDPSRAHRNERAYGPFSRSFDLPAWVDEERITAEYRNGVLAIRLPRREADTGRRIDISGE